VPGCKEALKKLQDWDYANGANILKKLITRRNFYAYVVNHSDCWNNNLMFKLDAKTKAPLAMKFIDLQVNSLSKHLSN